jgi:hypothetical protein
MDGLLLPGDYVLELADVAQGEVTSLLEAIGFTDVSLAPGVLGTVLAVARLEDPAQVPLLAWQMIRKLEGDPRAPLAGKSSVFSPQSSARAEEKKLLRGHLYQVRLMTDDAMFPDDQKLFGALAALGASPERVVLLRSSVYLPRGSWARPRDPGKPGYPAPTRYSAWLTWLQPLVDLDVAKLPGAVDQIYEVA